MTGPIYGGSGMYFASDMYMPESMTPRIDLPETPPTGKDLEKFLSKQVFPVFEIERQRLARLEMWGTGKQPEVTPLKRNTERAVLQRIARTPWIPLMISTFAQQLVVDGYRRDGDDENTEAWATWTRNRMAGQQLSLNRATMTYGYSYLRVLDASVDDTTSQAVDPKKKTKTVASMRGMDPMECFALYTDPYADEYPQYVLEKLPTRAKFRWWLPNGDFYPVTFLKGKITLGELNDTIYGAPPFVRILNQIDLKGRCWGDVEGVIDLAARIDKTAFDRLMVQHFNSFKVRWATGLEQADTPEGVEQDKIRISNEDILIASEAEAKFGTLGETSMTGFIEAYHADLESFAAVMQLPPNLMGQVVNVAADALDAARRQTYQRLFEKQTMFGEAYAQAMRLAALIEGRDEDAQDFTATIHWQDPEVRSLGQFADAWGKIVDQLGVPKWAPWHKIPGVTQQEVEGWKKHLLDEDPFQKYMRELNFVNIPSLQGLPGEIEVTPPPPAPVVAPGLGKPAGAKPAAKATPGTGTRSQPRVNNKTGDSKPTK